MPQIVTKTIAVVCGREHGHIILDIQREINK